MNKTGAPFAIDQLYSTAATVIMGVYDAFTDPFPRLPRLPRPRTALGARRGVGVSHRRLIW